MRLQPQNMLALRTNWYLVLKEADTFFVSAVEFTLLSVFKNTLLSVVGIVWLDHGLLSKPTAAG
jgi:hypothetical protein